MGRTNEKLCQQGFMSVADNPSLYAASVPVFQHYLGQLAHILHSAQQYTAHNDDLLQARLAPDMLPFHQQVEIAANFSLRASFPLAGLPVPSYGECAPTWPGLHAHLGRAQALLASLAPNAFHAAAARTIKDQAGQAVLGLKAPDFLHRYALPNFFFHCSMAYAIARHQGLPLGKADFDGLHRYA
jgi:uncharacterized protein